MYKIRFVDLDLDLDRKVHKEADAFFESNVFEIPVFPFSGMAVDLSTFLDESCSTELKYYFSNNMAAEIEGIIFCKNHIDCLMGGPQDHMPFENKKLKDTFPVK